MKYHLRTQIGNLSWFQKSEFCGGIKIFSSLPCALMWIKSLSLK